jgi:hypothetical protein
MCAARWLLARPVQGSVGERDRLTHLVYVPEMRTRSAFARACCGRAFGPGELELLDRVAGMPCEACLRDAALGCDERKLPQETVSARVAGLEAAVEVLAQRVDRMSELLAQAIEPTCEMTNSVLSRAPRPEEGGAGRDAP